jgi:hypothetical protein
VGNATVARLAGRKHRPRAIEPRTASTSERQRAVKIIGIANETFATDRKNWA